MYHIELTELNREISGLIDQKTKLCKLESEELGGGSPKIMARSLSSSLLSNDSKAPQSEIQLSLLKSKPM